MAKRKTKAKARRATRATGKSAARKRARKAPSPAKRKRAKRIRRTGTPKSKMIKPSRAPSVEAVVVDVIEEPLPGVITVTEFEETDIRDVNHEEE